MERWHDVNSTSSTILAKRTLRVRLSSLSGALNSTSSAILVQRCVELDEFGNPRSTNSTTSYFLKCRKKCYGTEKKEAISSALGDNRFLALIKQHFARIQKIRRRFAKNCKQISIWSGVEVGIPNARNTWKNHPQIRTKQNCVYVGGANIKSMTTYFNETIFLITNTPRKKEQQATRTTKQRRRKYAEVWKIL